VAKEDIEELCGIATRAMRKMITDGFPSDEHLDFG
jgi:hypothetical protein